MEILLALTALAIPVTFVWLVFSHIGLRRTVHSLREDVDRLRASATEQGDVAPETPAPVRASPWDRPKTAAPPEEQAPQPTPPPLPEPEPEAPPRSFVFDAANIERLTGWVKANAIVVVAALSLAMAGIFFVQYGIENGILSPPLRVLCALGFGGALIGLGEWVRRRTGDGEDSATAFLPSTFAGAGIVTLFSAILAARQLYGLIGPETAFAGLIGIAGLAVLLGWLYGPFLTVVGIVGAVAAPFIVGGEADGVRWLFYYLALIAAIGLGVDAMKRSAWVSAIALALPWAGAILLWMGSGSVHVLAFAVLVAIAATCIPGLSRRPAFGGAMIFHKLHGLGREGWPEFPVRLSGAALLALAAVSVPVSMQGEAEFWLALAALSATLAAIAFWLDEGGVLDDVAVPVAGAMLAVIGLHGALDLPATYVFFPENGDAPTGWSVVTLLVGFGLAISALAGWKSLVTTRFALLWAAGAAAFAPGTVILLAQYWEPLARLDAIAWASHAMAVAAGMTFLAERTRRGEKPEGLRTALFAVAALNMLAFALSIVLTEAALTLGFAMIVLTATLLDRRFDLWPIGWFVQLGVVVCGYRLVVDPGIFWALDASIGAMTVAYLGTVALLAASWFFLHTRERTAAIVVTESAVLGLSGVFVCLLIYRALDDGSDAAHLTLSLFGIVWLLTAATQLHRARIGGFMRKVRLGLGAVFGGLGVLLLAVSATVANPLAYGRVVGPPILDSLMFAYLLPALIFGIVAWKFDHLDRRVRTALGIAAAALGALYVGLEIRRLWQGADIRLPGVEDGELYSYTIAMLSTGFVLLLLALMKRSVALHKAALVVIALTIAKVFLVDMSGLEGLVRVLSFLALGLSLAGLALMNRWMTERLKAE